MTTIDDGRIAEIRARLNRARPRMTVDGPTYAVATLQAADLADLLAEVERLRASAEQIAERAWDAGNCCGLDGWIGPDRGEPVDDEAMYARRRDVAKILMDAGQEGDQ